MCIMLTVKDFTFCLSFVFNFFFLIAFRHLRLQSYVQTIKVQNIEGQQGESFWKSGSNDEMTRGGVAGSTF